MYRNTSIWRVFFLGQKSHELNCHFYFDEIYFSKSSALEISHHLTKIYHHFDEIFSTFWQEIFGIILRGIFLGGVIDVPILTEICQPLLPLTFGPLIFIIFHFFMFGVKKYVLFERQYPYFLVLWFWWILTFLRKIHFIQKNFIFFQKKKKKTSFHQKENRFLENYIGNQMFWKGKSNK